ncbi:DUF4369 domain-containing protein [Flavobacterium sp.]|uniref:DUF4369 domain-containing protein n=1 Tax=Flavobacterium sp. TaxID=239 RepID=UPI004034F524
MKKFALALMAVVLFIACKKEDHGDANLHIKGNIKGLSQGKLYIQKVVDTSFVSMDTIVINDNKGFESHLKIDGPQMLYLVLDRGETSSLDNVLPFFAEPGNMTIESSNEEFFKRAKITGSKNQKVYEDFLKIKSRFTDDNLDLEKQGLLAAQYGNVKKLDSVEAKQLKLEERKYLYTLNFAVQHADLEVAPYLLLTETQKINTVYLDTLQKKMTPKVAKSLYGKMLSELIAQRKKAAAAQ